MISWIVFTCDLCVKEIKNKVLITKECLLLWTNKIQTSLLYTSYSIHLSKYNTECSTGLLEYHSEVDIIKWTPVCNERNITCL